MPTLMRRHPPARRGIIRSGVLATALFLLTAGNLVAPENASAVPNDQLKVMQLNVCNNICYGGSTSMGVRTPIRRPSSPQDRCPGNRGHFRSGSNRVRLRSGSPTSSPSEPGAAIAVVTTAKRPDPFTILITTCCTDHTLGSYAPEEMCPVNRTSQRQRARWPLLLALVAVLLVGCASPGHGPAAVPTAVPNVTSPPGTSLPDGFVVAEGSVLVGEAYPNLRALRSPPDMPELRTKPFSGWTAQLLVVGEPLAVFNDYVAQAGRIGYPMDGGCMIDEAGGTQSPWGSTTVTRPGCCAARVSTIAQRSSTRLMHFV